MTSTPPNSPEPVDSPERIDSPEPIKSPSELLRQPIVHIDDDATLKTQCENWLATRLIAVDTEFMRVNTYYPIAALIQVNDGLSNFLIDPLKITDWRPLAEVLSSEQVIKAFHACGEDLDVFNHLVGCLPAKLFDTQVAAALLGIGAGMGYGNLVKHCLQVELPKGETRSNWLARPLSEAQLRYAALDVDYLFELANVLEGQLKERNREPWLYEDCLGLIANYKNNLDPASGFYKSNNTWRLKPKQRVAAKAFFEWRENTARSKNIPRSRILKDAQIFDVLMRQAQTLPALKALGLHDGAIRKFGREIIAITATDYLPGNEDSVQKPLTKLQRERIKELKTFVSNVANDNAISTEVLVRKAEYQSIARATESSVSDVACLTAATQGWRHQFFTALP